MCDQDQLEGMGRVSGGVNRRQFTALGAMGAVAACAPMESPAADGAIAERGVSFAAPGGTLDGVFLHRTGTKSPGVILWPDIAGLRPAKVAMGRRLAADGFAVLVANPYYRSVSGVQFEDFDAFRSGGGFDAVGPWRAKNTPEAVMETSRAVAAWLDTQDAVDTAKGIGVQGYCMTGSWTILGAAAAPSRIKAAGSFHGGGLVGDAQTSPVNLLDDMADDAAALIAIAKNDDAQAPGDKTALRAAADAAGLEAEVEVYQGDHGWTVLDSPVYNQAEADRAWANLLELYRTTL